MNLLKGSCGFLFYLHLKGSNKYEKMDGFRYVGAIVSAALTGCGTTQQETASNEISVSQTDSHYPVTVESYNYAGDVVTTTYEKAPERVIAVYQGSIETMLALGLEEHVVASYGLDNAVKEEWEDGLSKMNYHEEVFAPSKEDVMMLEPDMIFSWGSLFGEKKIRRCRPMDFQRYQYLY